MCFKLMKIKPCDNTFFGDGNQFNFDISNIIKSKNTPYPSVFFGAIFTAILTHNDEFRKEFFNKGKYDHEKILEIGQVYLFNEEENKVYIKAPMDLFMDSKGKIHFGKFVDNTTRCNCLNYKYILENPIDRECTRTEDMYINIKNIYDPYLKKQKIRIDLKHEKQIFIKNYKVGIGIDKKTKNVKEGQLYKIQQTEFTNNEWSYIVEYQLQEEHLKKNYKDIEIQELNAGYLKLGGENKACKFMSIENPAIDKFNRIKKQSLEGDTYKILFTSETYFTKNIEDVFKEKGIEVLGMSNGKPIYIGGYDMKGNKDKKDKDIAIRKMYKGYEAGTVVLIRVNENSNIEGINKELTQDNDKKDIGLRYGSVKGFNNFVILKEEL